MNSLLAVALAAQVVSANPLVRRQVSSSSTLSGFATSTLTATPTLNITVSSETFSVPTTTIDFTTSVASPTASGGSHGSYWYCYFPGSSSEPTDTYSTAEPTETFVTTDPFTDTFTDTFTDSSTDTFTDTFTDTLTDTFTDTESASVTDTVSITDTVTPTSVVVTATVTATSDLPSVTDTDTIISTVTDTDFPTATDTFTTDLPITTDLPTTTVAPTGGSNGVSTFTVVGPAATQVIKCIRVPRWGHHHPPPPHYPPHHGGTFTLSSYDPTITGTESIPTPTSWVETVTFPSTTGSGTNTALPTF